MNIECSQGVLGELSRASASTMPFAPPHHRPRRGGDGQSFISEEQGREEWRGVVAATTTRVVSAANAPTPAKPKPPEDRRTPCPSFPPQEVLPLHCPRAKEIDHKDLNTLRASTSPRPARSCQSRITGTKAGYQRQLGKAVQRARASRPAAVLRQPLSVLRAAPLLPGTPGSAARGCSRISRCTQRPRPDSPRCAALQWANESERSSMGTHPSAESEEPRQPRRQGPR